MKYANVLSSTQQKLLFCKIYCVSQITQITRHISNYHTYSTNKFDLLEEKTSFGSDDNSLFDIFLEQKLMNSTCCPKCRPSIMLEYFE